ncbi:MAG TPA: hypothetical protein VFF10_08070 [Trueperaceae bacterium]|nr:hypothetical protein [Trueperaceae bacterium]
MRIAFRYWWVAAALASATGPVSAMDLNVFVPGDTIKAAEVNENFANLVDAIEGERTLAFPAPALGSNPDSPVITAFATGLRWQPDFSEGANLLIPKPTDWDGTTDVVLEVYFFPLSGAAGAVDFFIRPRAFDIGDIISDASSQSETPVPASGFLVLAKQSFTIEASRLSGGELWHITIQRGGGGETYPDDVVVVSVAHKYNVSY